MSNPWPIDAMVTSIDFDMGGQVTFDPESGVLSLCWPDGVDLTATDADFVSVGRVLDLVVALHRMWMPLRTVLGRPDREAFGQIITEMLDAQSLNEHPNHVPL